MEFVGASLPLSEQGLSNILDVLKIGAAEIWTVVSVETGGCGYLPDRRPLILFERHWFHKETKGVHSAAHPSISSPTPGGYLGGIAEYGRLNEALRLDRHAALNCTSWGLGQIMGFNSAVAGFASVEVMVNAMVENEDSQLLGMANFMKSKNLAAHLANRDWEKFAKGYNGPDFKKNKYDEKLQAAFDKFSAGPLPEIRIRQAQVLLRFLGFNPGVIDGLAGNKTRDAVKAFRQQQGLGQSDAVDDALIAALLNKIGARGAGA